MQSDSSALVLFQVYADYESNPLLRQGIEFCCRQFYILHRKPFILQLFASVAPLLEFTVRADKVPETPSARDVCLP